MSNKIPYEEVRKLTYRIIRSFNNQYGKDIDPAAVTAQFIPPRVTTRIGFEVTTTIETDYLKIRLYAIEFTEAAGIHPFLLEDIQNEETGPQVKVFVSISNLPRSEFPVLSRTKDPIFDGSPGPDAIELEDFSGYIQAENGDYLKREFDSGE